MTRHVLDQQKARDPARMSQEFARIDADVMPRPQTQELQKRPRKAPEASRLKAFTDIERAQ